MDPTLFLFRGEARFYFYGHIDFRVIGIGLQKIPSSKLLRVYEYYAVVIGMFCPVSGIRITGIFFFLP